jgi:16S rRNA (guanine527-N7)-methyltransferase
MRDLLKQQFGLNDDQLQQFAKYYELLIEKNKMMNLTAITDKRELYIKHFYDSLTISRAINLQEVTSVLDVGTGAGFPGIPLKIAFPHLRVVLLDSLQKRVHFLQEVGGALDLKHVEYIHGRAEEIAHKSEYREQFDLVTSRAVAKLNVLAEYCVPFVRSDGLFVAMKGAEVQEEVATAKQALFLLGRATCETVPLALPDNRGERHLLVIQKKQATPKKYPRKAGVIKKILI